MMHMRRVTPRSSRCIVRRFDMHQCTMPPQPMYLLHRRDKVRQMFHHIVSMKFIKAVGLERPWELSKIMDDVRRHTRYPIDTDRARHFAGAATNIEDALV